MVYIVLPNLMIIADSTIDFYEHIYHSHNVHSQVHYFIPLGSGQDICSVKNKRAYPWTLRCVRAADNLHVAVCKCVSPRNQSCNHS